MEYNNSQIEPECKLYRNLTIDNSKIGSECVIADDTTILNSEIQKKVCIERRNFIQNVNIYSYSYTGVNTVIKNAFIQKFCNISWNVSIGGSDHNYSHLCLYTDYWFKKTLIQVFR